MNHAGRWTEVVGQKDKSLEIVENRRESMMGNFIRYGYFIGNLIKGKMMVKRRQQWTSNNGGYIVREIKEKALQRTG